MPPRKRRHQQPSEISAASTMSNQSTTHAVVEPVNNGNTTVTQPPNQTAVEPSPGGSKDDVVVPVQSIHGLGNHITQATKQKIIEGQFIELGSLLPSQTTSDKKFTINASGELVAKDVETRKITTIEKWTDAMLSFSFIYLEAHPVKLFELLKYIQIIRLGASRGSTGWVEYDTQYRTRKAQDPTSSWGDVDTELWLLYMTPAVPQQPMANTLAQVNSKRCFDFNFKGSCQRYPCPYPHACIRCGASHPIMQCPIPNQVQPTHNFRPPTRFQSFQQSQGSYSGQPFQTRYQGNYRAQQYQNQTQRPRFRSPHPRYMGPRQFAN